MADSLRHLALGLIFLSLWFRIASQGKESVAKWLGALLHAFLRAYAKEFYFWWLQPFPTDVIGLCKQYNQLALDPVAKSVEVMLGKTVPRGRITNRITNAAMGLVALQVGILFPLAANLENFPKHLCELLTQINDATGEVGGMSYNDAWVLVCSVLAFMAGWSTKKVYKFWFALVQQNSRDDNNQLGDEDLEALWTQYLERHPTAQEQEGEWLAREDELDDGDDDMVEILEEFKQKCLVNKLHPEPGNDGTVEVMQAARPTRQRRRKQKKETKDRKHKSRKHGRKEKRAPAKDRKARKVAELRRILEAQMNDASSTSSSESDVDTSASSESSDVDLEAFRKQMEQERAHAKNKKRADKKAKKEEKGLKKRKKSPTETEDKKKSDKAPDKKKPDKAPEEKAEKTENKAPETQDKDGKKGLREDVKRTQFVAKSVSAAASKVPSPASRAGTPGRFKEKKSKDDKPAEVPAAAPPAPRTENAKEEVQTSVETEVKEKDFIGAKKLEEHLFGGPVDDASQSEKKENSETIEDPWKQPLLVLGGMVKTPLKPEKATPQKPEKDTPKKSPAPVKVPTPEKPAPGIGPSMGHRKVTFEEALGGADPMARSSAAGPPTTAEVVEATMVQERVAAAKSEQEKHDAKRKDGEELIFSSDHESQVSAETLSSSSSSERSGNDSDYEGQDGDGDISVDGSDGHPSSRSDDIIIDD
eukprot:g2801.t1